MPLYSSTSCESLKLEDNAFLLYVQFVFCQYLASADICCSSSVLDSNFYTGYEVWFRVTRFQKTNKHPKTKKTNSNSLSSFIVLFQCYVQWRVFKLPFVTLFFWKMPEKFSFLNYFDTAIVGILNYFSTAFTSFYFF